MRHQRSGLNSCRGHQLLLLVGLQLVVFIFLVGPLLESESFYVWWDRSVLFQRDQPGSRDYAASRNDSLPVREGTRVDLELLRKRGILLPQQNELSKKLTERNAEPPRNQDLYPALDEEYQVKVVLYVHDRPEYLRLVVEVKGIEETLLIVSHDGFYEEMNAIVGGILFCQVTSFVA